MNLQTFQNIRPVNPQQANRGIDLNLRLKIVKQEQVDLSRA
jgi:hypothetical protein